MHSGIFTPWNTKQEWKRTIHSFIQQHEWISQTYTAVIGFHHGSPKGHRMFKRMNWSVNLHISWCWNILQKKVSSTLELRGHTRGRCWSHWWSLGPGEFSDFDFYSPAWKPEARTGTEATRSPAWSPCAGDSPGWRWMETEILPLFEFPRD